MKGNNNFFSGDGKKFYSENNGAKKNQGKNNYQYNSQTGSLSNKNYDKGSYKKI